VGGGHHHGLPAGQVWYAWHETMSGFLVLSCHVMSCVMISSCAVVCDVLPPGGWRTVVWFGLCVCRVLCWHPYHAPRHPTPTTDGPFCKQEQCRSQCRPCRGCLSCLYTHTHTHTRPDSGGFCARLSRLSVPSLPAAPTALMHTHTMGEENTWLACSRMGACGAHESVVCCQMIR